MGTEVFWCEACGEYRMAWQPCVDSSFHPTKRRAEYVLVADEEPTDYDIYGPGRKVTGRRIRAMVGDQMVGSLILSMKGIHLQLWVHEEHRREGIATAMFAKTKEMGWKPVRGAKGYSKDAAVWADAMDWEDQ